MRFPSQKSFDADDDDARACLDAFARRNPRARTETGGFARALVDIGLGVARARVTDESNE
jgi:hypothetical protein